MEGQLRRSYCFAGPAESLMQGCPTPVLQNRFLEEYHRRNSFLLVSAGDTTGTARRRRPGSSRTCSFVQPWHPQCIPIYHLESAPPHADDLWVIRCCRCTNRVFGLPTFHWCARRIAIVLCLQWTAYRWNNLAKNATARSRIRKPCLSQWQRRVSSLSERNATCFPVLQCYYVQRWSKRPPLRLDGQSRI